MPKQKRLALLILAGGLTACLFAAPGCVVNKEGDLLENVSNYMEHDRSYSSQVRQDHLNYVEGERKRQSQFADNLRAFWANDKRYRSELRPQYEKYKELERNRRPEMDMCDPPETGSVTGGSVAVAASESAADENDAGDSKKKSSRNYGQFEYSTQRH